MSKNQPKASTQSRQPGAQVTPPKGRPTGSQRQRASAARAVAERQQRRNRLLGMAAAILLIVGVVAVATLGADDRTGTTTTAGFDLPTLRGSTRVTLAGLKGTPTVVNMFASWCDQCEAELPDFRNAAESLKGKVNFVFINSNETGDGAAMADRFGLFEFPVAADLGGTAGNGLYRSLGGTGGMPLTAFYDAEGNVVDVSFGSLVGTRLDQALQSNFGIHA